MTPPLIGLTGSRKRGRDLVGNLDVLADSQIDIFYADYSQAVIAAGGIPMFLPLDLDPALLVDRLDGLLLTGGNDIAPSRYRADQEEHTHQPEPMRDQFELDLLGHAAEQGLPTLGICRGLQLVNVFAGGTLHQHVPEHAFTNEPGSVEQHVITIAAGSRLADIYGTTASVNSLHHQSVDQVGANFWVTATCEQGSVEGMEHNQLPIVAVQWHPEMLPSAASDPIFTWLIDTALINTAVIDTAG